jgi:dCMP deaminase
LALALVAATRSEDPWVPVGAVVLRPDNSVAGLGYNGAPSGVEFDWTDREARRSFVIHAETNALRYCTPGEVRDGVMAVSGTPCPACLTSAAAHGLRRVIFADLLDNYPADQSYAVAHRLGLALEHIAA